MNADNVPVGGVLSDQAISDLVDSGTLIVNGTFEPDALQPASYDLKVARDEALVAGKRYPPGSTDVLASRVVLAPGEAAMFSTKAMFRMPATVAGNVTVKNRIATEGLMLLSGLLIDPGYGEEIKGPGPTVLKAGCRLYLHVANIGKDAITINPETEAIARVQFLGVVGGTLTQPEIRRSQWIDQIQPSLGFLTELKDLKEKWETTSNLVQYVVMLGFVVLGITLIGVSLSTILTLATNTELVRELRAVWPHSASGKVGLAGVLMGVPLCLWVLCWVGREVWRASEQRRRERRRRATG
jgi:deoxycytidine triphosphate deaminase